MEPPDPASILSVDDQLSLWVGRVARVHALLEYGLSNVHGVLRPPEDPLGFTTSPASVDLLIDECRKLLKAKALDPEIVAAGAKALSAAKAANTARNRVVHDMWLPASGSEVTTWHAFRRLRGNLRPYALSTLHSLDNVIGAHTYLVRSRLQISGLFMALNEALSLLPDTQPPRSATSELPRYTALMKGEFTLGIDGDFEIAGT